MKKIFLAATAFATVAAARPAAPAAEMPEGRPVIVFLGDSLTEGYGVKPSEAYPSLIERRLAEGGWTFRVENQSRSGDTSGEALERASQRLDEPIDVLVVALGFNDGAQGLPYGRMDKNLRQIVEKTYRANPKARIVILGTRMPLERGLYARRFNDVFRRVAWEYRTAYLPFLLEDVIDVPAMTLADRIHPNPAGHRLMAERVWGVLEPVLKKYYPKARRETLPAD
jgi:acyl-CoA thioesterase I